MNLNIIYGLVIINIILIILLICDLTSSNNKIEFYSLITVGFVLLMNKLVNNRITGGKQIKLNNNLKNEKLNNKLNNNLNNKLNENLNNNLNNKLNDKSNENKEQLELESKNISHLSLNPKLNNNLLRVINDKFPQMKYQRRRGEFKKTLHWGQLKLMLTEIDFLTQVLNHVSDKTKKIIMVYAGSAPGHHIIYLSELFPMIYFELYDPNEFAIKSNDKIKTHVQYFTNSDAKYWSESKDIIVFCSDIRTEPATEEAVRENMKMQLEWVNIIKPELSMLKFRLEWNDSFTEYLMGDIYIQPFAGQTSTETRLIVKKNAKIIKYDNRKYEEQCFYHNNVLRKMKYKTLLGELDLTKDLIDNCYDCSSMIVIIQEYLKVMSLDYKDKSLINKYIKDIQNKIMFGKYNLLTKTKESFAETLDELNSIDTNKESLLSKKHKHMKQSVATLEDYERNQ